MPIENRDVARRFEELAELLEIEGENPFRVRAYREAASTVYGHSEPVRDMVERGDDLAELSGIGEASAKKIRELVETGRMAALEKAVERVGRGIARLTRVAGLGPKRLRALREHLGTGEALEIAAAARDGRLAQVQGFGPELVRKVLAALEDAL